MNDFISEQDVKDVCIILNETYQSLYNHKIFPFYRTVHFDDKQPYPQHKIIFATTDTFIVIFDSTKVNCKNEYSVDSSSNVVTYTFGSDERPIPITTTALQRPILPQYWKEFMLNMCWYLFKHFPDEAIAPFGSKEYLEKVQFDGPTFADTFAPELKKLWKEYTKYSKDISDRLDSKLKSLDPPISDQQYLKLREQCIEEKRLMDAHNEHINNSNN